MMQVWCYDTNKIFTESIFVEEVGENMTTVSPNGLGLYCKKFDGEKWIEGWTQEQIDEWIRENTQPPSPNKTEILESEVTTLKAENEALRHRLASTEDAVLNIMLTNLKV